MNDTVYYISEASKKVEVEPHVLRYWEDELELAIRRNEMGHRCYTGKDIETLRRIKQLKEQGLQLKAIRMVLQGAGQDLYGRNPVEDGRAAGTADDSAEKKAEESAENRTGQPHEEAAESDPIEEKVEEMVMKKAKKYMVTMSKGKETVLEIPEESQELKEYEEPLDEEKEKKAKRLQYLLQHMVTDAVKNANREMCTEIKESILKELDYQFRQQEERDEERKKREEEHFRKIDEMISQRRRPAERFGRGKKKEPLP
ncbi:MAG: MerR family transcriptional regulator [Lachnospiraceae bacterium]|jgi:DNA-binding transcriptional MerR regulator|nr:MerR family transcriptional regulator [Lachnospiraceae bacterium]MCI9398069.1 MerR family transcriptional regulator [Lachnospiraceae bacterium]